MSTSPRTDPPTPARVLIDRDELRRAVQDLGDVVKQRVDVVKERVELGRYVADRPWVWMGGAFAAGLLLALRRMWRPARRRVVTVKTIWRPGRGRSR